MMVNQFNRHLSHNFSITLLTDFQLLVLESSTTPCLNTTTAELAAKAEFREDSRTTNFKLDLLALVFISKCKLKTTMNIPNRFCC